MAGIGRTPIPIFIGSFLTLLFAAYLQLSRPFLSDFHQKKGIVLKYEVDECPSNNRSDCLYVWLKNMDKPFYNPYSSDYKPFLQGDYTNKEITIWTNSKREFFQIVANNLTIIKYVWFFNWNLILIFIFLLFHYGAFMETKNATLNINTYGKMWAYTIGQIEPIMKHNYRKYNPNDVLNTSWFDDLFTTKRKKKEDLENQVTNWKQFFHITGKHGITKEVRTWLMTIKKGKIFLEGYDLFYLIVNGKGSIEKINRTTNEIFEFISIHLDRGREYYEVIGKPFKENFPKEYYKIMDQLNRLR
ncbi:hypothetical protein [Pseudozobellia sp. WGM2]|uniref:hypothetical protein n=1 Tax=Pseudozobellia sp. WGM2 TaxID=2787625 RepID=UPI001ADF44B4|nr:hypothetical protein [Pseudozobellia sp. WGM2]